MASASSENSKKSTFLGKTGSDESPIDKTFYNILNVSPKASSGEIKKAYYALSLQYHPDRTQSLDEATRREYAERFKAISHAYTILSDPEKRSLYNKYGRDENLLASESAAFSLESLDPNELFRYLFGGEEFQAILGEFELAKTFKSAFVDMVDGNERTMSDAERAVRRQTESEEKRRAHEQRVNELSKNLIEKLNLFTDACHGTKHDPSYSRAELQFLQTIQTEMQQLIQAPYGENLLHSIGYIYSLKARLWSTKLDSEESAFLTRLTGRTKHFHSSCQEKVHVVRETFRTLKSTIKWGQSVSRLAQATEGDTDEDIVEIDRNLARLEYSGVDGQEKSPKSKTKRKSSSKSNLPLTVEQKQELEADMVTKSMQALWQAVKLEVESVQREVCDKVLNDSSCDREVLRRRCFALSKIGHLWQNVESAKNSTQ